MNIVACLVLFCFLYVCLMRYQSCHVLSCYDTFLILLCSFYSTGVWCVTSLSFYVLSTLRMMLYLSCAVLFTGK